MKRIFVILLLIVLIMQSGGLFMAYKLQQYTAKSIMSYKITQDETGYEPMTLSLSDYAKSLVEKNEIYYRGKMYDIKTRIFSGDSVKMKVIHDEREGKVLKKIKNLMHDGNRNHKKTPLALLQLLGLYYLPASFPDNPSAFDPSLLQLHSFAENIITRDPEVFIPPPERV